MNRQQILDKLNVIAFSSYEYSEIAREAISLLIEDENTLEKQTPKKPKIIGDGNIKACFCPICGTMVIKAQKHCFDCSQALDWGNCE